MAWRSKKQPHATLKQTQRTLLHPSQLFGGPIINSKLMPNNGNNMKRSPPIFSKSSMSHSHPSFKGPKFHKWKLKKKSQKRLLKKKKIFSGSCASPLHSVVPWSICFGPPWVVALLLQHCAAQTELHVGQRGTTWDEGRCKEICLEKVLFWGLLQRIGEE